MKGNDGVKLIIRRDFKAITEERGENGGEEEEDGTRRNSKEKMGSGEERKLLNRLKELELFILHGNIEEDKKGEYTNSV